MDENMDYTPQYGVYPRQIASFFFETKVSLFGGVSQFDGRDAIHFRGLIILTHITLNWRVFCGSGHLVI